MRWLPRELSLLMGKSTLLIYDYQSFWWLTLLFAHSYPHQNVIRAHHLVGRLWLNASTEIPWDPAKIAKKPPHCFETSWIQQEISSITWQRHFLKHQRRDHTWLGPNLMKGTIHVGYSTWGETHSHGGIPKWLVYFHGKIPPEQRMI